MSKANSQEQMLEFAIAREVEAHHFYLAMADRMANPAMRKLFEDLAAEELEHKAKLELEVMKRGRTVATEQRPGRPSSEYILSEDTASLDMDYRDVLLLAMEKEDAAFRIYVNLVQHAPDEESREMLLSLAQEEVKHKLRFEAEYDALLKEA